MENINATSPHVWRLGIHGARNAGKTCYLASLYGFRTNSSDAAVIFVDEVTIDYLAEKWQSLMRGERPSPNPKGMPNQLRCEVTSQQRVWQVAMRDYAGELIERNSGNEVPQLRQETHDWMKSCDALLFFLDITEPEAAIRERLNELGLMLAKLRELTADGNTITRPLALVLTKWDTRPDFDASRADASTEFEKACQFLHDGSAYGQFFSTLEQSGDRVQFFPASAFGSHCDGNLPPLSGPQPFNIHAPLVWSLKRSEDRVAEKAEQDSGKLLNRRWSRYSRAIRLLQGTISSNSLSKGTAHDRLAGKIRDFRQRLWRRRICLTLATAALLITAVLSLLVWDEDSQYKNLVRAYGDPSVRPERIKDKTAEYLRRWKPFKILCHEADILRRWAELQEKASAEDFSNLDDVRRINPSDADAKDRLKKDEEYLSLWGSSSQAPKVKSWQAEDQTAADKYEASIKHEQAYEGLKADKAILIGEGKYAEAVEACHRFLAKYPNSPYCREIEESVADVETGKDERDWKAVVDFSQKNPNSFGDTIKEAHRYLGTPSAKHRQHAEELVSRTEDGWDRSLYEQVCKANREGNDANGIAATHAKATAYRDGGQPRKCMTEDVQKWLDWFNALQQARDYYVVVRSMTIPQGSNLEPSFSLPDCRIEVTVLGRSYWTDRRIGMKAVYGEKLGPYRFKWGQMGTFGIHIEGYHPIWWKDEASHNDGGGPFIISRLDGPINVRDPNGKDVIVYLECDDVRPPNLPPYPNNRTNR